MDAQLEPHYKSFSPNLFEEIEKFASSANVDVKITNSVAEILQDVRDNGDRGVLERTLLYDKANLSNSQLLVSDDELDKASSALTPAQRSAINESIENVTLFHKQNLPKNWESKNSHGALIGENYYPIGRVGIYVPGGNVPLVSTVIMTATLAKVAGVKEIVVTTPPNSDGSVSSELLAALGILGIKEVYKVGGAQAVGALGFGTETIRSVDKIFGPGNAYVNEAKRQVFGCAGIDLLPGPSEVMVIADDSANPSFIAAALIAQAEHGSGKEKIYLIFSDSGQFEQIISEIKNQSALLTHRDSIIKIFNEGFLPIHVKDLEEAISVANFVAPEHLELQVNDESLDYLQSNINTAGALLLGHFSATALGDFVAGPSHVLPTGRSSRFSSGLRIEDFFRRTSIIKYDKNSLKKASASALLFSEMEKLDGHGNSISIRLNQD